MAITVFWHLVDAFLIPGSVRRENMMLAWTLGAMLAWTLGAAPFAR